VSSDEIEALATSLTISLRAVLFGLPLAIATAYALARGRWPGKILLDALVLSPLVLPPVVIGYVLLLLFGIKGPIGSFLDSVFGVRMAFTSEGASLAVGVMAFPLMVRAVRLSLEAMAPGLDEAAASLGASRWDRMFSVHLPLAAPGIISAAIIGFAAGLGEFGAVITFVSNVPGETQTLPLAIYSALQQPGGDDKAARLAMISMTLAIMGLLCAEAVTRFSRFAPRQNRAVTPR
jgi:molybdate transport system permease protein